MVRNPNVKRKFTIIQSGKALPKRKNNLLHHKVVQSGDRTPLSQDFQLSPVCPLKFYL